MRLFMGMTLESLAKSLHVTHPTILSWERYGNNPTVMTDSTEAILRIFAAQQGAKDNELIGVILNRFFGGPIEKEEPAKCATIVELNPNHKEEIPKIHFSNKASDLRLLQEA
jgi:transcriptional regulator with XRE-family HTH domain